MTPMASVSYCYSTYTGATSIDFPAKTNFCGAKQKIRAKTQTLTAAPLRGLEGHFFLSPPPPREGCGHKEAVGRIAMALLDG